MFENKKEFSTCSDSSCCCCCSWGIVGVKFIDSVCICSGEWISIFFDSKELVVITSFVFVGVEFWDEFNIGCSLIGWSVKSSFKWTVDGESVFVDKGGGGGSKSKIKCFYKWKH